MWNSDHTPTLLGKLTADQFPVTAVTIYLGHKDVPTDTTKPPYEGYVHFENAFWQEEESDDKGLYTIVYTEHLGYFVFFMDTVLEVMGQQGPS